MERRTSLESKGIRHGEGRRFEARRQKDGREKPAKGGKRRRGIVYRKAGGSPENFKKKTLGRSKSEELPRTAFLIEQKANSTLGGGNNFSPEEKNHIEKRKKTFS